MFYIIGDLQKKHGLASISPLKYPILRHTQFCPWENPPSWRSGVTDAPPLDVAKVLEMAIVVL